MTTNVKPGDMAIIVKAYDNYMWTRNRVVKIKDSCCRSTGNLVIWTFEEPLQGPNGAFARCAYDRCLKKIDPLTDPEDIDQSVKVGIFDEIPEETNPVIPIFEETT